MQPSNLLDKFKKQTIQLEQVKQQIQAEIEKRKQGETDLLKAHTKLEQYEVQIAKLTRENAWLRRQVETPRAFQANNKSVKSLKESFERLIQEVIQRLMGLRQEADNLSKERLAAAIAKILPDLEALYGVTAELFTISQDLERERQHYQELFELAPDGYLVADNQGIIWEANGAAATLLNIHQELIVGKPLTEFVAEADCQHLYAYARQFDRCRKQHLTVQPRSGKAFPAAVTVSAICDSQGETVGWRWLMRAIAQFERAEQALKQSKERFRLLVESVKDYAIFMLAPDGRIITWNAGAERIKGYRAKEIIGRHFQCFYRAEDVEKGLPKQALRRARADGRFESEGWRVRKDGTLFWANAVITALWEQPGQLRGFAKVTRDMSDRKQAEEARLALEKEQELNQLQRRFFSMVSHEFRTPLSTILASAQILEHCNQEWLNEKVDRNLHRIQTSVKHTLRLLEDILTINRAETGKIEFRPQLLALKPLCHQLVEQFSLSCDRTINLRIKGRDTVCLDEKLLHSILSNLLANAIKYSPDDTQVTFSVDCQSKAVIFLVQDRGIGIPAEDIPNLFDPFYRGKNVEIIAGSGLGLAVVKQYVELHGGKITIDSNVGRGTTVKVVLPI